VPRVEQAVPLIHTRDFPLPPLRVWTRLVAAGVALACLAVLVTGAALQPNAARGISTHTQLGLPECQFEARTGLPCPSCGFTTSVSFFAHGNLLASLYVQPTGFVIALLCAMTVWAGFYIALTGRPVHRLLARLPVRGTLIALLSVAIGGWGWKIWIHLTGRDHWPL
jgi:hypothetical protein